MGLFPFQNEPFLDFSSVVEMDQMVHAVAQVRTQLGRTYDLRIGSQRRSGKTLFDSVNPAQPAEVVGHLSAAEPDDVEKAVLAAESAFRHWSQVPAWDRAALLLRAGHLLRQRRRQMLAWIALEVGKNWSQADGEVAEAIDHFEWNARELLRWSEGQAIQPLASEFNQYRYRPLGVGAVISPFNFPTTLPLGMIVAAIAAGNTVVFKPAEDASVIAHQLVDILDDAGLPPGVVNLITGDGATLGPALVSHPRIRFVAFVGSRAVGTQIHHIGAAMAVGQTHFKRVMTEMGGKNATVVADDADLSWAVSEILSSAFGYQGQKCSATSRVIAMRPIYDELMERVATEAKRLLDQVGLPQDNAPYGPLINQKAVSKVLHYQEIAQMKERVVLSGGRLDQDGYVVSPLIVADVLTSSPLFREEIFGPVLTFTPADTFSQALELANDCEYALTGAVFTRSPKRLASARQDFYVGNLYLNRSSTGAMAGVHPFGGYKGSGTGPKVGSPDYLGFFLEAQTITEKVRY